MIENIKLPKIYVNAEFQRLWWTNVSGGLLLGVLLIYALFIGVKEGDTDSDYLTTIGLIGMFISGVVAYFLIERSLKQDVESNAFDQLRMSSLSPWQMVYSRILVAPLLAWVGFLVGWVLLGWVLLIAAFVSSATLVDNNSWNWNNDAFLTLLAFLFLAWAFACMALTNALQFGRGLRQWSGSAIQLILMLLINMIFFNYLNFDPLKNLLWSSDETYNILQFWFSNVLLAIFASVAVNSAMAQRLHLKSAHGVFLVLSLLSPLLFSWNFTNVDTMAKTLVLCYGCATIVSILTQNNFHLAQGFAELKQGRFRLPAWVVLFPLGLLVALPLDVNMAKLYLLQIGGLLTLVWIFARLKLRYQAITMAMMVYLFGFCFLLLIYP